MPEPTEEPSDEDQTPTPIAKAGIDVACRNVWHSSDLIIWHTRCREDVNGVWTAYSALDEAHGARA
jgi:hypothetical protein